MFPMRNAIRQRQSITLKGDVLCIPNEDGTYTRVSIGAFSLKDTARSQAFDFAAAKEAYTAWAIASAEKATAGDSHSKADAEASKARTAARMTTMTEWLGSHELVHATATEVANDPTFEGWGNLMVGSILSKMEKEGRVTVDKEAGKKYYTKAE